MRISYDWLKNYVNVKVSPEKLAEILTMAGFPVESVGKSGSDHILEIEVTSNRPDCLSLIGIAREVSALTGAKLKIPPITDKPRINRQTGTQIKVKVDDKKLCPRYTARVIRNVKVGGSPEWLKPKLETMGLRSVNNIVDITNFCLFETGEPMHAFDLDKIDGGVIVRRARKGEKITTIDGVARPLDGSTLVIADSTRPIAIAGVMGALNTEVTSSTRNILLESAFFDPVSVRRTSRSLGLSTESSYRFERRADPANILYSSDRASGLIVGTAGGAIGELVDIGDKAPPRKEVTLRHSRCNNILGVEIAPSKIKAILSSLGMRAESLSKDKVKLEIPSFRNDLQREIDLIEEVARIYGYGKIPLAIPDIPDQPARIPSGVAAGKRIRAALTGLGFDEIITYSLLSKREVAAAGVSGKDEIIEIENPLSAEQEVMRPSLIAGMLDSMLWNLNRKNKDLKLFELGNIYIKETTGKFSERMHLSIGMTGEARSNWAEGSRESGFFDLKGAVETLFLELGIEKFSFKRAKHGLFSASSASIEAAGEAIGMLGAIDKKTLANFDIKDAVYYCELCAGALLKHAAVEKRFKELPKYPSVSRDISIVVGIEAANADIIASIKDSASAILKGVKLIDRYAGRQVPDGKISLTYRLEYHDSAKTLEEKDVSAAHATVIAALESKFGAKLR